MKRDFVNIKAFINVIVVASAMLVTAASAADSPLENSLGMKFVQISGQKEPLVKCSIWETRVRDYQVFKEETQRPWKLPEFEQTPDDPAVNVTWEDAEAFCRWLTEHERKAGRLTAQQRYRLPTDEEWSAAVGLSSEKGRTPEEKLKTSVVWPWGSDWPPRPGDGNYASELEADRFVNTSPVGRFKPNRNGLFDLGGNVWEWCDDWFNEARVTKVLRGGSFHDNQPKDLLAAYRFSATVHLSNDDIGFRVVIEDATQVSGVPKKP